MLCCTATILCSTLVIVHNSDLYLSNRNRHRRSHGRRRRRHLLGHRLGSGHRSHIFLIVITRLLARPLEHNGTSTTSKLALSVDGCRGCRWGRALAVLVVTTRCRLALLAASAVLGRLGVCDGVAGSLTGLERGLVIELES